MTLDQTPKKTSCPAMTPQTQTSPPQMEQSPSRAPSAGTSLTMTDPIHSPEIDSTSGPTVDACDKQQSNLSAAQVKDLVRLHKLGLGTRKIAKKIGVGRKTVRNLLTQRGLLKARRLSKSSGGGVNVSKLEPFREEIKKKVQDKLTNARILREIKAQGYQGGLTILADYTRTLRIHPHPTKKVWRRFETAPGEEIQFDWSPYRVPIGGSSRLVHAFAATLGYCRKAHVRFYPDEREPTLLEAHVHAFEDFGGVARRGVYDRMSTVVLGTIGKEQTPLWNPHFRDFVKYYGYEPYLCKVADPDRKGKDERIFWYLERDFIRGTSFASFDDLNAKVRLWLDEVANQRVHGTTRKIPDEAWHQERPFLIGLPDSRYPAYDEQLREVGPDAVVSVRGTPYTVPAKLASQKVCVHLYSDHFDVCGPKGQVAFSRPYVPDAERGRLVIEPMHYESVRRRGPLPGGSVATLEDALLSRFPGLAALCAGIRLRMKSLAHVHLRALWRLADRYGDEAFADAARRAQSYRRFDAQAIRRILEHEHPLPPEEPEAPLTAAARVLMKLGNVDGGSLDDYAHLDSDSNGTTPDHGGDDHDSTDNDSNGDGDR